MTVNEKDIENLKQSILENSDSRRVSESRAEELSTRYIYFSHRTRDNSMWSGAVDEVLSEIQDVTESESMAELSRLKGIRPADVAEL